VLLPVQRHSTCQCLAAFQHLLIIINSNNNYSNLGCGALMNNSWMEGVTAILKLSINIFTGIGALS
jgi:hypothetical protein